MQFHLNGFQAGDPRVHTQHVTLSDFDKLPNEVDALNEGCGPAGLTLAA